MSMYSRLAASSTAALLCLANAAHADGKFEEILARGHVIIGTGSTNPPWHFMDETNTLVGFDVDIGHLFAKAFFDDPSKVVYVDQSSDSRIPNLVTGKVDITCQFMTVTPARAQQVEFTIPYYREGVGLMVMENGPHADYEALKAAGGDVTVSVLQNVFAEDMVHRALPEAKVDQYDSVDLMYQALNSGRAHAAATDQSSLRWFMVQNPGRYKDAGFAWDAQTYSCAVNPGEQRLLNFLNTTLLQALTGVEFEFYSQSYKHWFGVEAPSPITGFPAEYR